MAVMALSGSVHDIAGDGIYMEALTPTLQSKFVGWQGAFYNIAKVLAKGDWSISWATSRAPSVLSAPGRV